MRKLTIATISMAGTLLSPISIAQGVKSIFAATNGVNVTIYSDDFARRYEYSAPTIHLKDGFALVAKIKKGDVIVPAHITGSMMYSGEWRHYNSAIFRGGDAADFTVTNRNVGRCYSSLHSRATCTLSEGFNIKVGPDEIAKYSLNGILPIQIRAEDGSAEIISIPVAYFDAVNEASKE